MIQIRCINAQQAHAAMTAQLWPWVKSMTMAGNMVDIHAGPSEDSITNEQRGYLHAVVLTEIAQFAKANGEKFPMAVWKEWFRSEFLGFKVVTSINPFTKKKVRRRVRISTEDLGVRGLAQYIDRVIAFAATDLGVVVSEPLPPHLRPGRHRKVEKESVDPETGEIMGVA